MVKHVFDKTGLKFIRNEEAHPICGKHFCDRCGDCLHCDWDTDCLASSEGESIEHSWIQYGEIEDGS